MELDVLNILKLNSTLNNLIEGFDDFLYTKKINLTIKDKILILLNEKPHSPFELIKILSVAKTNLALICQDLIKDGLIRKEKDLIDKRNIIYSLTDVGRERAINIALNINKQINMKIEFKNNNEQINNKVKELLQLLS